MKTALDQRRLNDAIRHVLTRDNVLNSIVEYDQYGQPKVYINNAPGDTSPPYIVWHRIGGESPAGTYEDDQSIRPIMWDTICWGGISEEAWQLATVVEEVVRNANWSGIMDPYYLMSSVKTIGDAAELQDRDTGQFSVAVTYRMSVAR